MNSAIAKEQLNQYVNSMCEELAERQCSLIKTLEETRVQKSEALNTQLSEKQSLLDNAGLIMYTQELLKENDQPCFVQAARVTHNRCECVCVSVCVTWESVYVKILKYFQYSYRTTQASALYSQLSMFKRKFLNHKY